MSTLLAQPAAARPLGALGLALAGLLLMGFHQVVEGALQQAEQQHARLHALTQYSATCASEGDVARRELCVLRAQRRLGATPGSPLR